jgi:hypothetical protein
MILIMIIIVKIDSHVITFIFSNFPGYTNMLCQDAESTFYSNNNLEDDVFSVRVTLLINGSL